MHRIAVALAAEHGLLHCHLKMSSDAPPEFCLTTQHFLGGGGGVGGGLTPPPPPGAPSSDWANFSLGLQPIKNFLWRLRRKSV